MCIRDSTNSIRFANAFSPTPASICSRPTQRPVTANWNAVRIPVTTAPMKELLAPGKWQIEFNGSSPHDIPAGRRAWHFCRSCCLGSADRRKPGDHPGCIHCQCLLSGLVWLALLEKQNAKQVLTGADWPSVACRECAGGTRHRLPFARTELVRVNPGKFRTEQEDLSRIINPQQHNDQRG